MFKKKRRKGKKRKRKEKISTIFTFQQRRKSKESWKVELRNPLIFSLFHWKKNIESIGSKKKKERIHTIFSIFFNQSFGNGCWEFEATKVWNKFQREETCSICFPSWWIVSRFLFNISILCITSNIAYIVHSLISNFIEWINQLKKEKKKKERKQNLIDFIEQFPPFFLKCHFFIAKPSFLIPFCNKSRFLMKI